MLVPSSWSTKAGPFKLAAQIVLLIAEMREELNRIVFEASTSASLVEWCKTRERIPLRG